MSEFLGLARAVTDQGSIEVSQDHANRVISFSISGIEIVNLRHEIKLDGAPRAQEKYISCLCYSGRSSAADIATVNFNGPPSDQRLGFVFPANCFSEPELIEGGWQAYFAEIGFRKSLTIANISKFSTLRLPPDSITLGNVRFDEVFSEDISVLVMSVDAIKTTKMALEEIELSLIAAGIYPLSERRSENAYDFMTVREGPYRVRRVSSYFQKDAHHFVKLIRRADQDRSGVGAFLTYYQVIEYCISYILGWSVRDLSSSDLDAWKLREALSNAANEKNRFNKLYSDHTSPACDHRVFEEVRLKASKFIASLGVEGFDQLGWCELVYKSRNLIVHNQITIFRSAGFDDLMALNKAMRSACLEIITHFVKIK